MRPLSPGWGPELVNEKPAVPPLPGPLDAPVTVTPNRAHIRRCIFLTFVGLYVLTSSGRFSDNPDMTLMYGMGHGLAYHGRLAVPREVAALLPEVPGDFAHLRGRDGALYSPKGVAYSVAMVPFILAGRAIQALAGEARPPYPEMTMLMASLVTPLLAALNCVLLFETLVALGFAVRRAGVVTLVAGSGTILWAGSSDHSLESVTGVAITAAYFGLVRLARCPRPLWGAWIGGVLGLLVVAQPTMVALVLPLTFVYGIPLLRRPRVGTRMLLIAAAVLLPLLVGLGLVAWSNTVRYGSPLATGYEWAKGSPTVPLYVGIYGLLFSAGKSLFLYSPPLVLAPLAAPAFIRRVGWLGTFPLAVLGMFLVVYGRLSYWSGDGAWGPRYLVPLTGSLSAMLAGFMSASGPWEWRLRRATLAFSAVAGAAVNLVGSTTSTGEYFGLLINHRLIALPPEGSRWSPVLFDPELSPIVGRAHCLTSAIHRSRHGESLTWIVPGQNGDRGPISLAGADDWQPWLLRLQVGDGPGPGLLGWWPRAVRWALGAAVLLAGSSLLGAVKLWQLTRRELL